MAIPNYNDQQAVVYDVSTGTIHPVGGVQVNPQAGNYTPTIVDHYIEFSATAIVTLDSTLPAGKMFRIKFTAASGALTFTPTSGLIDGNATQILIATPNPPAVDVIFNGTNWRII